MDERVKNMYQKIYAELFRIFLLGCCISVLVKVLFLDMNAGSCIPEFPLMIGSPIYMLIRSHMLGVTQIPSYQSTSKSRRRLGLVLGILGAVAAVFIIKQTRGLGTETLPEFLLEFVIPFVAVFLIVQIGVRKWEEKRQKKLDDKYGDS